MPTVAPRLCNSSTAVRTNAFPKAAVTPNGIYVTFNDKGTTKGDKGDVFFAKSTDGGATWTTTKLNDAYFGSGSIYDTPIWRASVTCQEIGHTFGLDHQDESGANFVSMARSGKSQHQLLRSLKPEVPINNRKAQYVRTRVLRRRVGWCRLSGRKPRRTGLGIG